MADKKPTADNWPVVSGDYIVGDPESPVAVTTLASHNEDIPASAGAVPRTAVPLRRPSPDRSDHASRRTGFNRRN